MRKAWGRMVVKNIFPLENYKQPRRHSRRIRDEPACTRNLRLLLRISLPPPSTLKSESPNLHLLLRISLPNQNPISSHLNLYKLLIKNENTKGKDREKPKSFDEFLLRNSSCNSRDFGGLAGF
ncbi:hypothetical protein I3843_01G204700 [Carya illinoinensis]|uniref:Uncharacterized protein n=1 Tax=Carya illinoinensis TaxID=32201 RepID=A0A922G318_CARIL|nr:hypothetical protein I3842_01G212700 [Carya illinoinensis]KAG7997295.1 hypothetical protein I3843_01G204700 [Carya illinoinensis]